MGKIHRLAAPLLLLIVAVVLLVTSLGASCDFSSLSGSTPTPKQLGVVDEAWNTILNDYVDRDKVDLDALSSSAIKAMLESIHDPYAAYFDAAEYKTIKQTNLEGTYGGIGAVVTIADGNLTVIAPIAGTPAERAGIKPQDKILEINGNSTQGMSLEEAVLKIQGETGTQVTLQVLHQGEEAPITLVITREEINLPSVYPEIIQGKGNGNATTTPTPAPTVTPLPNGIALITITYFSEHTGDEIVSALNNVLASGAKGIVLDLRDNPGGVLDSAVAVASQFLKDGIVLYALDSNGNKETWDVEPGGLATDLPLAVLVNGNSASASEVVAGALQDYERAPLIGNQTFGKGSINHFRQLSDGSAIYISIGRWYTPNGKQIEGQGLTPDIVVERTEQDVQQGKDPQLDKAIEYIKSKL
ncbi:MAG: S41 family peptidase [Chloroflexi bacterium]|nr:S41 family peptidase [Chloroflexota bacterium]